MAGANGDDFHGLRTLLSGDGRDFLVRNNGDQVKVGDLEGKIVGIYFSAHRRGPCRRFNPKLVDAYADLSPRGFEVVFVSAEKDEVAFGEYFSEMPWLAVPVSDSAARARLDEVFQVDRVPHLVILEGSTGRVLADDAVGAVREHGAEGFPFTPERLSELREAAEAAAVRKLQALHSVLASPSRDSAIIGHGGDKLLRRRTSDREKFYLGVPSPMPTAIFATEP